MDGGNSVRPQAGGHTMTGEQLDANITARGEEPAVGAAWAKSPSRLPIVQRSGHSARENAPHPVARRVGACGGGP